MMKRVLSAGCLWAVASVGFAEGTLPVRCKIPLEAFPNGWWQTEVARNFVNKNSKWISLTEQVAQNACQALHLSSAMVVWTSFNINNAGFHKLEHATDDMGDIRVLKSEAEGLREIAVLPSTVRYQVSQMYLEKGSYLVVISIKDKWGGATEAVASMVDDYGRAIFQTDQNSLWSGRFLGPNESVTDTIQDAIQQ
jgi:hypothetical protein